MIAPEITTAIEAIVADTGWLPEPLRIAQECDDAAILDEIEVEAVEDEALSEAAE